MKEYKCPQGVAQSVGDHASLSGGRYFDSPLLCGNVKKKKKKGIQMKREEDNSNFPLKLTKYIGKLPMHLIDLT